MFKENFFKAIGKLGLKPVQIVVLSFVIVISIGTLLLLLPQSRKPGMNLSIVNALFTAASATCVTGLTVVNISNTFTLFGQLIILTLIQIGGLGLMTMVGFFSIILRNMSLNESLIMRDTLNYETLDKIGHMLVSILLITFTIELIGATSLYLFWIEDFVSVKKTLYFSVFHAVSAFCNAGFSLFQNSFTHYNKSSAFNLIITSLIILGGLGFIVITDVIKVVNLKLRKKPARLKVHTKLVLIVSIVLIISGTLILFFFENKNLLCSYSIKEKLMISYFQSVTARTAGFNTINVCGLANVSCLILMILMFIGASPGSTGGGIKTSTFGIAILSLRSFIQGRQRIEIFKRSLPRHSLNKVFGIIFVSAMFITVCVVILLTTEKASFMDILFEEMSAFGTVGLSRGITSSLSTPGKLVITITMLTGRIGPLAMALAVTGKRRRAIYAYPEEEVILG
ncbi:MAG: Trk family potassium uptake protein [Candidatus Aureabacteria bacterium]|nr:Trk family potassium uptake protein [Candidatus Auribacterota bacterium]